MRKKILGRKLLSQSLIRAIRDLTARTLHPLLPHQLSSDHCQLAGLATVNIDRGKPCCGRNLATDQYIFFKACLNLATTGQMRLPLAKFRPNLAKGQSGQRRPNLTGGTTTSNLRRPNMAATAAVTSTVGGRGVNFFIFEKYRRLASL